MTKVRIDFPYLKEDTDRHGNVRIYVRRNGCKIRIREPKGSPDSRGPMRKPCMR